MSVRVPLIPFITFFPARYAPKPPLPTKPGPQACPPMTQSYPGGLSPPRCPLPCSRDLSHPPQEGMQLLRTWNMGHGDRGHGTQDMLCRDAPIRTTPPLSPLIPSILSSDPSSLLRPATGHPAPRSPLSPEPPLADSLPRRGPRWRGDEASPCRGHVQPSAFPDRWELVYLWAAKCCNYRCALISIIAFLHK